ncbi:flagellar filament capping protein FliD [Vibrio owensii]|uniref:flagellar filament capping protein FliD n=1 Tax=Vibrio owensii TaxID=696485 RepID=UPI0018F18405|nr:flagellar filament capping protein FliD [Vibrio owensii]
MQIDAAGMAQQLAAFEVMPFENRYYNKLDVSKAKSSAMASIKSILTRMDTLVYDFTKYGASVSKTSTTTSTDEYIDVTANTGASQANLSVFVEQMASAHQLGFKTTANDASEVFATTGTVSIEMGAETFDIDLSQSDEDGDGSVTYAEFASYFNREMDGKVTASIVQSGGGISMMFSSDESGAANSFSLSATTDSGFDAEIGSASSNPLQHAQDAVIWLGGEGSGLRMTNSTNLFENLVDGLDVTVKKANASGDSPTSVTSESDIDASLESVNEFVSVFNELLGEIQGSSASGGESASRGILASDPTVRGLRSQMTNLVRSDYGGTRLFELGMEIDRSGKLVVDAEKFEEAMKTKDVDAILTGDDGFFGKVESLIESYTDRADGLLTRNIDSLEAEQRRYNDAIDGLNDKYEMYYNRYLKQYTQLNTLSTSMESIGTLF